MPVKLQILLCVIALSPYVLGQHTPMPAGMSHEEHMKQMNHDAEMKKRGDAAMGFDQDKVSHHFYLTRAGGIIEVGVNLHSDDATRNQIRAHLKAIAKEFAVGVFNSPIATHAEMPPGAAAMRERKARITYTYEETPAGAHVVIKTKDRGALIAVHDFLKYQIREHKTGDPILVQPAGR